MPSTAHRTDATNRHASRNPLPPLALRLPRYLRPCAPSGAVISSLRGSREHCPALLLLSSSSPRPCTTSLPRCLAFSFLPSRAAPSSPPYAPATGTAPPSFSPPHCHARAPRAHCIALSSPRSCLEHYRLLLPPHRLASSCGSGPPSLIGSPPRLRRSAHGPDGSCWHRVVPYMAQHCSCYVGPAHCTRVTAKHGNGLRVGSARPINSVGRTIPRSGQQYRVSG